MSAWAAAGLAVSIATAAAAAWRSVRENDHYYAAGVYRMTRRTHAFYALAGFVLAVLFAVSYFWSAIPVVAALAAAVLLAIFYFTSFLRGFSDEE